MVLVTAEIDQVELDVDEKGKIGRTSSKDAKDGRIIAREWSRNQPFPEGIGEASSN